MPGNAPGLNRSRDLLVASSRPNSTWAICPSVAGSVRHAPGLPAKPLLEANCRPSAGSSALIACHVDLVTNVMGMADVAGAGSDTDGLVAVFFARWIGWRDQISQRSRAPAISAGEGRSRDRDSCQE